MYICIIDTYIYIYINVFIYIYIDIRIYIPGIYIHIFFGPGPGGPGPGPGPEGTRMGLVHAAIGKIPVSATSGSPRSVGIVSRYVRSTVY